MEDDYFEISEKHENNYGQKTGITLATLDKIIIDNNNIFFRNEIINKNGQNKNLKNIEENNNFKYISPDISSNSNYYDLGNNYNKTCSNSNNNCLFTTLYINLFPKVIYNQNPEKEYLEDILSELLIEEENNLYYKKYSYVNYQKDLNNQKRAKLITFIYQMSTKLKFKTKTNFLAVQTMDRFLCKVIIDPEYYELLCICSLFIASKFNETYYPSVKDMLFIFGKEKKYTLKQALNMELLILESIEYNLLPIFPMCFFNIISEKMKLNDTEYYLGSLICELIQFEFFLYPIKNSILAQSVFCKVISLTRGEKYDPLNMLKIIFPQQNLPLNIGVIIKSLEIIDELLYNLEAEYFKDIYQKYFQPHILGKLFS